MPRIIPFVLSALIVVAVASACAPQGMEDAATVRARETGFRGIVLPTPVEKQDFTLTDTSGEPFPFRERTDGHLTLLFFGYTNCPDICPVHMANLGAVLARYPADLRNRIRVVFVTTDPDRDTPAVMRSWLDAFDPAFIGLAGPFDEVNRIQQAMNLPAAMRDATSDGSDEYLVGHSAQVLAFTPDDVGRVSYPFGTRQADWVLDIPKLLNHKWTE